VSGRASQRPDALNAVHSLPDGMSPGERTQNRSLRYKRLERPAHRVSGERQNARYFLLLMLSHPLVSMHASGQETIPSTGRPLGKVAGYTELNKGMTDDTWSPFSSEMDFNLAPWFVRIKVAKSQIDEYFAVGLGCTDSRLFCSAYPLRQQLNVLEPFRQYLVWVEPTTHDGRPAKLSIIKILSPVSAT